MIYFFCGLIVGVIVSIICIRISKAGILRIDHFSSEKDIYRFEISNLDSLSDKKYIILKLDNDADLSQK